MLQLLSYNARAKYPLVKNNNERVMLVYEYADYGNLFDIVYYTGYLEECIVRTYFQQIVAAIRHCHKKGILHKVLTPAHIFLDLQFNVKLANFGLTQVSKTPQYDMMCTLI